MGRCWRLAKVYYYPHLRGQVDTRDALWSEFTLGRRGGGNHRRLKDSWHKTGENVW